MPRRYGVWWYLAGAAAARTGDEMSGPALLLAEFAATGSASAASSLLAAVTVAAAAGGPVLGALLDRSARPGALLACSLAAYAAALTGVLVGLGRLPFGVVLAVAVLAGLPAAALSGGWTAQLPGVAAPAALPRANALDAATFGLASLLGPALAGAVTEAAGAPASVAASIALICLALAPAWGLPARRDPAQGPPATSIGADLAAGFLAVVRIRPLTRATTASVISCAAEGVFTACTPLLGRRVLGGADRGALLLSAVAASALVTGAVLSRRPLRREPQAVIRGGTLVLAAALLLAATCRAVPLITAAVLCGVGQGPLLIAVFAVRHREAPGRLRGQVFTTGASLKLTAFAVGAGLAGPLAARSLPGALLIAAGAEVLAALSAAPVRAGNRWPYRRPVREARSMDDMSEAVVLAPGSEVTVRLVKDPRPEVRYPAVVAHDDGTHVTVTAPWAGEAARDAGYVTFEQGDVWTEHYWRDRWYSVKEIRDSRGLLKGWYCDVTRPSRVEPDGLVVTDLDLDLWVSADRSTVLRLDEDEFLGSGLEARDPAAARRAREALDELEHLARSGELDALLTA